MTELSTQKRSPARSSVTALELFLCLLFSLWTLDVLVNLALPERLFFDTPFFSDARDFVGLLVAELQIAALCYLGGFAFAACLARFRRGRINVASETLGTSSALVLLLTLVAGARIAWGIHPSQLKLILILAGVPSALGWVLIRLGIHRSVRQGGQLEVKQDGKLLWTTYPAWIAGSLSIASARMTDADWKGAVLYLGLAILGLALVWQGLGTRSRPWRRTISWIPFALAFSLAAHFLIQFQSYGKLPEKELPSPSLEKASLRTREGNLPDIVLIVLDTVRADHLRRFGYYRDTMPTLESWASQGIAFQRAVSPAGWTAPAHASIFSGKTVSQHGIHHGSVEGGGGKVYQTPAHEGIEWLPEVLGQRGYYSMAVSANPIALPRDVKGFRRSLSPWRSGWYDGTLAALLDKRLPFSRSWSEKLRWRIPYVDAEDIVSIVERAVPEDESPVFLFVNFLDAHSPYDPPTEALEALGASAQKAFPNYVPHNTLTRSWHTLPESRSDYLADLYDGELRWMDINLARLFPWLERRFGENAVIIVTSDHGEALGEETRVGHEYGLGQNIVHVPLFIHGPGLEPAAIEKPVSLRRLYDFVRSTADTGSPSVSVLQQPDPLGQVSERYPFYENIRALGPEYNRTWTAMFEDGYKGVGPSNFGFQLEDVKEQGFDRAIPTTNPAIASSLREKIDTYWETYRDRRDEANQDVEADTVKMLKELGYVNQ